MADEAELSFGSRLWFAWVCYFRVLFDGAFAARAWQAREARALPAAPVSTPLAAPSSPAPPPPKPVASDTTSALQLLGLLQREGRLVDFVQQDIASASDADVAAAARVVHEGCRKALRSHVTLEPVRPEDEGARLKLEAGFDADAIELVGDVKGSPPYAGVLQHKGWRAAKIELPSLVGDHDARVLAPAQVELG